MDDLSQDRVHLHKDILMLSNLGQLGLGWPESTTTMVFLLVLFQKILLQTANVDRHNEILGFPLVFDAGP